MFPVRRPERPHLDAGCLEALYVLAVVEGVCVVHRDGRLEPRPPPDVGGRIRQVRGAFLRDPHQHIQVHRVRQPLQGLDLLLFEGVQGLKTQMSLSQGVLPVLGDLPEDLHPFAVGLHGHIQFVGVLPPGHLVEDDPCDLHLGVEGTETVDDGRRAPRKGTGVHDEHHREPQQFGHIGGRSDVAVAGEPLVQTPDALHDAEVRILGRVPDHVPNGVVVQHEGVEVPGRPAGGGRVVHGVNEVGPGLEGLNLAPLGKEGQKPSRHRRLSDPAAGTGNHEAFHLTSP